MSSVKYNNATDSEYSAIRCYNKWRKKRRATQPNPVEQEILVQLLIAFMWEFFTEDITEELSNEFISQTWDAIAHDRPYTKSMLKKMLLSGDKEVRLFATRYARLGVRLEETA